MTPKDIDSQIYGLIAQEAREIIRNNPVDEQYGGRVTRIVDLPVGTRFHVCNGLWNGELVEVSNEKYITVYDHNFTKAQHSLRVDEEYTASILICDEPRNEPVDNCPHCTLMEQLSGEYIYGHDHKFDTAEIVKTETGVYLNVIVADHATTFKIKYCPICGKELK